MTNYMFFLILIYKIAFASFAITGSSKRIFEFSKMIVAALILFLSTFFKSLLASATPSIASPAAMVELYSRSTRRV